MGLPTAVIPIANNQLKVAKDAAEVGVVYCMGKPEDVAVETIVAFLKKLLINPIDLASMSAKASTFVDGRGAEHVAQALFENS